MARRTSSFNHSSNHIDNEAVSAEIVSFAQRMRSIPRKALRCEIYGTTRPIVDRTHAMNIFRKVFPGKANDITCYDALAVRGLVRLAYYDKEKHS